jgi:DNA mismatch repair protein MutS2
LGDAAARAGLPLPDSREGSEALLAEASAAATLRSTLDFSRVRDVRAAMTRLEGGADLPGEDLAALGATLAAAAQLADALDAAGEAAGALSALAPRLRSPPPSLAAALSRCLSFPGGAVLDAASEELASVRATRRDVGRKLRALLAATGARLFAEKACDAPQVVSRRQRQCVPVRLGMSGLLPGCVVLDQSASGATLFVEPAEAVPLNNDATTLSGQQSVLEERVLAGLSAKARRASFRVADALDALTALDLACARAAHGRWCGGGTPRFTAPLRDAAAPPVSLRGARHPLLLAPSLPPPPLRWWEQEAADAAAAALALATPPPRPGASASASSSAPPPPLRPPPPVPVDWLIPPGAACVVVTGPNTGGKTASMKTLALACLLARAGGHPPTADAAAADIRLPWARRVLADLGDSQSLSEGLSTFSGHIARLGRILEALDAPCPARDAGCDGVALVLLDEPGGGTDPAEGAALACALLEKLAAPASGALTVATSHYEEAKRLGMAADADAGSSSDAAPYRFANAAVEFDAAALAPTYRLLWGVTGESYALEVAAALGLPAPLLAAATAAMAAAGGGGARGREARAGALAARLDAQLSEAETAAAAAASARAAAVAEASSLRARAAALLPGEASLSASAEADAAAALASARAAFGAVSSSDDPSAALTAALAAHTPPGWDVSVSAAGVGAARRLGAPEAPAWCPRVGSRVRVRRLGTRPAVVVSVSVAAAEVEVRLGLLVTRVPISEVEPATEGDASPSSSSAAAPSVRMPSPRVSRATARAADAAPASVAAGSAADASALIATPRADNTIDLRGMYVDDALAALDAALIARGRRSGASALFVVHGVGTGRVKAAVGEVLRAHPLVLRAEAAPQRDGGAGCTVVYLR